MKAKMESTNQVVFADVARTVQARVWEGVTENGVRFTAYITMVQVGRLADQTEFESALQEHAQPSADTMRAIDARFIL